MLLRNFTYCKYEVSDFTYIIQSHFCDFLMVFISFFPFLLGVLDFIISHPFLFTGDFICNFGVHILHLLISSPYYYFHSSSSTLLIFSIFLLLHLKFFLRHYSLSCLIIAVYCCIFTVFSLQDNLYSYGFFPCFLSSLFQPPYFTFHCTRVPLN